MKKILTYSIAMLALALGASSCTTDDLMVESQTSITTQFVYSTPEGLSRAVVGLYPKDRSMATAEAPEYCVLMMDYCTDLMVFRGGTAAGMARLDTPTSTTGTFETLWNQWYQIIGKANEIIYHAEQLDPTMENDIVRQAYGEAKCFRARAYFLLYQRFERLYLNTKPTTVDNMEGRVYRPSSKSETLAQIKLDLEDAIKYLDWTVANGDHGRLTKAVAHHIRAQVAMWEEDWQTAIDNCEAIFGCPDYGMMPTMADVFNGPNLRNKEVLYAFQFSDQLGGGSSISDGVASGHRLSLITTPAYSQIGGMMDTIENGGYGWGRVYPNVYLFNLYDQAKDNRFKTMFKFKYYYNDPSTLPAGKNLGDEVEIGPNKAKYFTALHPHSLKFFDQWTITDVTNRTSFKDAIVYRLAETYLMAAEAYFHKDGGASAKALEYYNKTYERAMGEKFTGALTLQDLLDEYARECHFEGVRWPLLKRLGLLADAVKAHYGDTLADDPNQSKDYIEARKNWNEKWWRWPIPQSFLDVVGADYGQNPGW